MHSLNTAVPLPVQLYSYSCSRKRNTGIITTVCNDSELSKRDSRSHLSDHVSQSTRSTCRLQHTARAIAYTQRRMGYTVTSHAALRHRPVSASDLRASSINRDQAANARSNGQLSNTCGRTQCTAQRPALYALAPPSAVDQG